MLAAGDTFFIRDKHSTEHLHIIISDPVADPNAIVLVPVTSYERYKDETCILDENDVKGVSFLTHGSCIDFQDAVVSSEQRLAALAKAKTARKGQPVPVALVEKIRSRCEEAFRMPNKCLTILDAQNLA